MSFPAPPFDKPKPRRRLLKKDIPDELKDEARFIRSWFERPLVTGAVSPSGKALARMLASFLDPAEPGPVLELGPGTGPVTEAIVARGFPEERLVLIEFNPSFVDLLRTRFPKARIVQGDAYHVRKTLSHEEIEPFSGVISSLPLLTKPARQRAQLLDDCLSLSRPGAAFAQFTYGVQPPIPLNVIGADTRAQGSPMVWRNIPPARVWAYRRA